MRLLAQSGRALPLLFARDINTYYYEKCSHRRYIMTKLSLILDAILFVNFAIGSALAIAKLKKAKKIINVLTKDVGDLEIRLNTMYEIHRMERELDKEIGVKKTFQGTDEQ